MSPLKHMRAGTLRELPSGTLCFPALILAGVLLLSAPATYARQKSGNAGKRFTPQAQRFQDKLDYFERNARANPVQRRSTQINADEVNAWFREGGYKLPQGVETVVFHSQPETIEANA